MNYIELGLKIFGTISLLLIIFGTIGNLISMRICLKDSLYSVPTFVFYVFMLANNILCLYFWNLNHFIQSYFNIIIEDFGEWPCKLLGVLQFSSLQSFAWFLVTMSFERYLTSRISIWRLKYFNSKRALVLSIIIQLVIYLFNGSLLVTMKFDPSLNISSKIQCYSNDVFKFWNQLHFYLYSIVPFAVLALVNSLLLYETVFKKKVIQACERQINHERVLITKSILIMTFSFIGFLLPSAIVSGYFYEFLYSTQLGTLVLYILDCITFGYHALNFLVFSFTNKRFNNELKRLFCNNISSEGREQSTTRQNGNFSSVK
jgi:hypothetical protein